MEYYLDNIDSHCELFSCIIQTVYRGPYYTLKIKYVLSKFLLHFITIIIVFINATKFYSKSIFYKGWLN